MPEHDLESGTERTSLVRDQVRTTWRDSSCCGALCFISLLLGIGFVITMFLMGVSKVRECPASPFIPVYLFIASGIPAIIFLRYVPDPYKWLMIIFVPLIALVWFFAGNICVYIIYNKFNKTNRTAENYCDPGLYYFTFVANVFGYIAIILGLVYGVVYLCRKNE
ncbi:uncharacterized protein LOC112567284 isoform X1 [Pomacea canaliculata]|uniref:uncharacterized protein LOC112567284 isoform X1 n=1 Tax=Pomacea canaliculata TaxID=400727 RepID=UPI000D7296B9|nr:uncharacterized protein LOC112567284 isoform X1 [Pomacea canaliculata]